MRNLSDEEDDHDYSPNELARLSSEHNSKYRSIVNSNLESGDTIENWQARNMARAKEFLEHQRRSRK
jgi:hypothetical protein